VVSVDVLLLFFLQEVNPIATDTIAEAIRRFFNFIKRVLINNI